MTVAVRPAGPADAAAVAALEERNLEADAWSLALVADGVAGGVPTVSYWVAEVDGEVVGHAVASVVQDLAELQRIAVDPAHRRSGVATRLLAAVAATARDGGADRLLLEVRAQNTGALAFYRRSGFTEVDRRRRYYRDGATAVVMLLDLTGPATKVWRSS